MIPPSNFFVDNIIIKKIVIYSQLFDVNQEHQLNNKDLAHHPKCVNLAGKLFNKRNDRPYTTFLTEYPEVWIQF